MNFLFNFDNDRRFHDSKRIYVKSCYEEPRVLSVFKQANNFHTSASSRMDDKATQPVRQTSDKGSRTCRECEKQSSRSYDHLFQTHSYTKDCIEQFKKESIKHFPTRQMLPMCATVGTRIRVWTS